MHGGGSNILGRVIKEFNQDFNIARIVRIAERVRGGGANGRVMVAQRLARDGRAGAAALEQSAGGVSLGPLGRFIVQDRAER